MKKVLTAPIKDEDLTDLRIGDYIYYSGFSKCLSFRTVTDSYAAVPYISDHYPVTALLEF